MAAAVLWAALTYGGVTGGRAFAFAMLAALMAALALWQGIVWHRQGGIMPVARVLAAGLAFHLIVIAGLIPSLSRVHVARAIDAALALLQKIRLTQHAAPRVDHVGDRWCAQPEMCRAPPGCLGVHQAQ